MKKVKKNIRGEQLLVFAGENYTPVGASTDCGISFECTTVEVCAKAPRFRRYRKGKISWSVGCSGFYFFSSKILSVGQPIKLALAVLQRELINEGVGDNILTQAGEAMLKGEAIITDVEVAGSVGGIATYRISFQGSGEVIVHAKDDKGFPYVFPLIFTNNDKNN